MKRFFEFSTVFWIGGAVYNMIEILWRGYTHWTMTLTGGACFAVLYALHVYAAHLPLFSRCLLGAFSVTVLEFAAGCIVNLWLGWKVWDYSGVPLNFCGQVCLLYSVLWLGLCALSAPVCRRLAARITDGGSDSEI
ncbi:MAG: hypothetical protein IJZ08_07860 [Clostridia bacterium]|nr:hypothetical protein [Clostridia bacterium]